jgi:ectoine hydroxylase-related dioxygenase (phytanoyl-CoA dioxygenase family)
MNVESLDQVAETYLSEGVVRIPGFLDTQSVEQLRTQIERYQRETLPTQTPPDCTFEADQVTVRNLWRLEIHSQFFREFAARKPIVDLARRLLRDEPVLMAVETFNKPARVGSGVPYHQDNAYFCQTPPHVLTMWIAIDAVTPQNGPVCYVPGSQRWGMLPTQASGVAGNSIGLISQARIEESHLLRCTLEPGDLAVHHCQTVHGSAPNQSPHPRLGLLLVYRAANTRTDPHLKQVYLRAQEATATSTS